MFAKSCCPYCKMAQDLLNERELDCSVVDFENSQDSVLSEIKGAYEWATVPMIFLRHGDNIEFIGGFSDLKKHLGGDG